MGLRMRQWLQRERAGPLFPHGCQIRENVPQPHTRGNMVRCLRCNSAQHAVVLTGRRVIFCPKESAREGPTICEDYLARKN